MKVRLSLLAPLVALAATQSDADPLGLVDFVALLDSEETIVHRGEVGEYTVLLSDGVQVLCSEPGCPEPFAIGGGPNPGQLIYGAMSLTALFLTDEFELPEEYRAEFARRVEAILFVYGRNIRPEPVELAEVRRRFDLSVADLQENLEVAFASAWREERLAEEDRRWGNTIRAIAAGELPWPAEETLIMQTLPTNPVLG